MIDLALLIWSATAAVFANGMFVVALLVIGIKRRQKPSRRRRNLDGLPALTIVRPLRGLEENAEACHASLFEGLYKPAAVLFVAESFDDSAVEGVRPILERYPDRAQLLVSEPAPHILSAKVRNMIAGWEAARTPLVGFCDSDILLGREHLAACMEEFSEPLVSGASLPIQYVADGLFGRLSMLIMTIDNATLVRTASYTNFGSAILGGLMIFRRSSLDAVGGPAALGDALADDLRAGELLDRAGYRIRVADAVLVHHSGPESAWSVLARHHRWLTSIRTEVPLYFWCQVLLLNPIAPTIVAAGVLSIAGSHWATAAWGVFAGSAAARTATAFAIDRALLRPQGVGLGAWCLARLPADIMYLLVLSMTLIFPFVYWRGRWFRVRWGSGRILHEVGRARNVDSA
ncbi:MAG: glycosyltransferase [Alphaproteobacteria bacterium]|nr:glycosyltransferase [Alphaproteobacteria bacterium]